MKTFLILLTIFFSSPLFCHAFQYEFSRPDYESGWQTIVQGQAKLLTHNLSGNVDDYVVDLQTRSDLQSSLQHKHVHNRFYGGNIRSGQQEGLRWYNLNVSSITIYRPPSDGQNQEFRLRIWKIRGAHYDSGWLTYQKNQLRILSHGLAGNVDDYVVYMEFKSATLGLNQIHYGGAIDTSGSLNSNSGGQWARLTAADIAVARLGSDVHAEKIRVRIWRMTSPDYDSGWQNINQGSELVLPHNIHIPFSDYTVYLEFKDPGNFSGINNVYMGGVETGTNWYGGYIKYLTGSAVTLYRNVDDVVADQMRVRIWKCSSPKYDSQWISVTAGPSPTILSHGLPGTVYDDYITILEAQDVAGNRHNKYIGGTDVINSTSTLISKGFSWTNFDDTSIHVNRELDDSDALLLRLRMWLPPKADYDSGWFSPTGQADTISFTDLGGSPEDYYVYLEGRDIDWGGKGRNIIHLGKDTYFSSGVLFDSGFSWSNLSTNAITLNIGTSSIFSDEIRVRIWKNGGKVIKLTLFSPTGSYYQFAVTDLAGSDVIYDLQLDYTSIFGTANASIGGNWSLPSFFTGAYWEKGIGTITLNYSSSFDAIRLYSWDVSWQPKQSIPTDFPWPLFLPAIVIHGK